MPETPPEPWLRGPIAGISPLVAPALFSFEQAREDLAKHTEGLTTEQIWTQPAEAPAVGFQLRHIAGSVDRLTAYLLGRQLDESQLSALRSEMEPGASREELLACSIKRSVPPALRYAGSIPRRSPRLAWSGASSFQPPS